MNKTLKILAIASAIPAMLFAAAQLLKVTSNPYGLEKERLGPRGKEKIPSVKPVENAANFLLFAKYQNNVFAIHLPIPSYYFDPSRKTSRLLKSYAASVGMYYPAMYGAFHPSNADRPKCNGSCEGYIRAFIEVSETGNDARAQDARQLEGIQKDRSENNPLLRFEELDRAFGLDDHFQIRFPIAEEKWNGKRLFTKEYLIKRTQDGETQYLFECSPYMESPSCAVRFNHSSRPELRVQVRFGRDLLGDWQEIISSVDRTIASWGPKRVDTVVGRVAPAGRYLTPAAAAETCQVAARPQPDLPGRRH